MPDEVRIEIENLITIGPWLMFLFGLIAGIIIGLYI
jgi:hypothetical protein